MSGEFCRHGLEIKKNPCTSSFLMVFPPNLIQRLNFCTIGTVMHFTVIFGCGNLIMGDDGFGPAVVEELWGLLRLRGEP